MNKLGLVKIKINRAKPGD